MDKSQNLKDYLTTTERIQPNAKSTVDITINGFISFILFVNNNPNINQQQTNSQESSGSSSSSSTKTIIKEREIIRLIPKDKESEEGKAEDDGVIKLGDKTSITGATIGANLLSGSSLIIIITMLCVTFIIFLIVTSRTILRLKGK